MAFTLTRTKGRRLDDVRALRIRFRTITFSGNYTTGGETITAKQCGLRQIVGIIPLDTVIRAPNGVTGALPVFDVAATGVNVVVRALSDAAGVAGASIGVEKTGAQAYIANSKLDVLVIGA